MADHPLFKTTIAGRELSAYRYENKVIVGDIDTNTWFFDSVSEAATAVHFAAWMVAEARRAQDTLRDDKARTEPDQLKQKLTDLEKLLKATRAAADAKDASLRDERDLARHERNALEAQRDQARHELAIAQRALADLEQRHRDAAPPAPFEPRQGDPPKLEWKHAPESEPGASILRVHIGDRCVGGMTYDPKDGCWSAWVACAHRPDGIYAQDGSRVQAAVEEKVLLAWKDGTLRVPEEPRYCHCWKNKAGGVAKIVQGDPHPGRPCQWPDPIA